MDGGGRELLSIGLFARHNNKPDSAEAGEPNAGARRVLPRVLRRPARLVNRLLAGNIAISRRGWVSMGLGVVLIASGGVLASSKQGHSVVAEVSANMGFAINDVVIEGIKELSNSDVMARLNFNDSNSLFSFDVAKARADIGKLAWVRDVVVAKSYPDRLIVRIDERKPYAIWQNDNTLSLIERGGEAIDRFDPRYSNLPLLVGKGANIHGAEIIFLVGKLPVLSAQVKAYMRIAEWRWDLRLKNGITVRLPGEDAGRALRELVRLDKLHNLLARDITVVDLRLKDRFVVSLSDGVSQQRLGQSGESIPGQKTRKTEKKI